MSGESSIEWTDATWNPVRGCSRVSPGCENCYAEKVAARFHAPGLAYEGLTRERSFKAPDGRSLPLARVWNGVVRTVPAHLADPLRWKKPRRIFVNSMSDIFHEKLSNEDIAAVFGVMAAAPQHTFQVLTKRAKRMREWFEWARAEGDAMACHHAASSADEWTAAACAIHIAGLADVPAAAFLGTDRWKRLVTQGQWPLPNVWLGVSVEDQQRADERIPLLLATPAAVRFISAEPLLNWVNLDRPLLVCGSCNTADVRRDRADWLPWEDQSKVTWKPQALRGINQRALDWVIVGGESGAGARPFDLAWARLIVAQCKAAGVPCFVKQLGADPVGLERSVDDVALTFDLRDKKGGDMSEWPEDLRVREFPSLQVSS